MTRIHKARAPAFPAVSVTLTPATRDAQTHPQDTLSPQTQIQMQRAFLSIVSCWFGMTEVEKTLGLHFTLFSKLPPKLVETLEGGGWCHPHHSCQVKEQRSHRQSREQRVSMTTELQLSIIIINLRVAHSPGPFLEGRRPQWEAGAGDSLSLWVTPGLGAFRAWAIQGWGAPLNWAKIPPGVTLPPSTALTSSKLSLGGSGGQGLS